MLDENKTNALTDEEAGEATGGAIAPLPVVQPQSTQPGYRCQRPKGSGREICAASCTHYRDGLCHAL